MLRGLRAAAAARPARADHGLHDPLPRRGDRRARPDDDRDALARLRPALAAALAGAGQGARRAVHPLLRARRAGAPRDALARLHREAARDEHPHPRRPRPGVRLPRRPPGALRRRPARPPGRAGRPARPQRRRQDHAGAAPQRHPHRRGRRRSSVSGLPVDEGEPAGDPAPRRHRLPGPRRPAVHRHASARTSRSARPTSGSRAPALERRVMARARPGRHGRLRRPAAPPPLLRAAAPGRGRDGAGDGAGDPGARRAVVQPRPGLAARAGRHPALARRDRADGHPRPALRPRAVPPLGGARRRRRGGRRGDVRRAHRRRADARPPAGAARSGSTRGPHW